MPTRAAGTRATRGGFHWRHTSLSDHNRGGSSLRHLSVSGEELQPQQSDVRMFAPSGPARDGSENIRLYAEVKNRARSTGTFSRNPAHSLYRDGRAGLRGEPMMERCPRPHKRELIGSSILDILDEEGRASPAHPGRRRPPGEAHLASRVRRPDGRRPVSFSDGGSS